MEFFDIRNYSARCKKEEMEFFDIRETCTSDMAYDASQVEEFLRLSMEKNRRAFLVEEFLRMSMENNGRACLEDFHRACMITDLRIKLLCCNDSHLSEEVKVLRQRLMELKKFSVVTEIIRRNQLMEKLKLFIFLLAFLLHSGNDDYKHLARPERGKISCITVYLLGNDGAHSYNGNGILLTTRRKYTRFKNEELLDEIRPANLPLDVLQRQPTDKEIARLSGKLGQEYRLLAYELGLTRVQLDHLTLDCPTTLLRIERMFFIWRDDIEGNATFEILVKAMGMHGINPDIVCQCLERA